MIKFMFNHMFNGDRDNIYISQTVGVTLTVASRLYSTVCQIDTTNHILSELEQRL